MYMSAYFEKLRITEPPTSHEVDDLVLANFGRDNAKIVSLTCVETQEVPTPVERKLDVRVYNILDSQDEGHLIRGLLVESGVELDDRTVTIATEHDGAKPASLTVVGIH
jgi:hypothetical protein